MPSQGQDIENADSADPPIVGLARGEPHTTRSRGNSRSSVFSNLTHSKPSNPVPPILSSTRDTVSRDGVPRTDYVWRHPAVFENAVGQIQGQVHINAGLSDLSEVESETFYSDDEDVEGAEFGAVRKPAQGEEDLLFRDSGYGAGGMLPGLVDSAPMIQGLGSGRFVMADDGGMATRGFGRYGAASHADTDSTPRNLRRVRERRRSSAASQRSGARDGVAGVVSRIKGLNF